MNTETKKQLTNRTFDINKFVFKNRSLIKKNIIGLAKTAGRNNSGKITVWHTGRGNKKKYRKINFYRTEQSTGIICSLEYDPYRNSNIAAVYDVYNNVFFYIIAIKNLKVGDIVKSGLALNPKLGYSLLLNKIPVGSFMHNISFRNMSYAKISRAAGSFCQLKEKTLDHATIKLNSGKLKKISIKNIATIGIVSNEYIFLSKLRKAGQSRWLNIRPTVRGVAMNPVDHPNGGGEGKKSSKKRTPWGKQTK